MRGDPPQTIAMITITTIIINNTITIITTITAIIITNIITIATMTIDDVAFTESCCRRVRCG